MVWVHGFAQRERERRGGHTWWVLVAGEGPDEDLGRWRRDAAAVVQSSGLRHSALEGEGARKAEREKKSQANVMSLAFRNNVMSLCLRW